MEISSLFINSILVKEDIEGLIEAGAPEDEYLDEAAQLSNLFALLEKEQWTEDNVLSAISFVWLKSFSLSAKDVQKRISALRRVTSAIFAHS